MCIWFCCVLFSFIIYGYVYVLLCMYALLYYRIIHVSVYIYLPLYFNKLLTKSRLNTAHTTIFVMYGCVHVYLSRYFNVNNK